MVVMSDDLVAFLRARLDEDEMQARAAGSAAMEWREDSSWLSDLRDPLPSQRRAYGIPSEMTLVTDADAAHIARNDPARVLREVEAKRRIIDWSQRANRVVSADDYEMDVATPLEFLALPYADHPDYRQEWKT